MNHNQSLIKLSIWLVTISVGFYSQAPVKAQYNESFSLCVANVDAMSGMSLESAINSCKNAFQGRSPNEDYSVCVQNLDNFSGISVESANQHCSEVFQNSIQPQYRSNNSRLRRTIIINPNYPPDFYYCQ